MTDEETQKVDMVSNIHIYMRKMWHGSPVGNLLICAALCLQELFEAIEKGDTALLKVNPQDLHRQNKSLRLQYGLRLGALSC